MRLEILPRFVLTDLIGNAKALLEVHPYTKRVTRQAAQTIFVETSDLQHLAEPVTDSRFHGGNLLLDVGSRRPARGKSRDFLQDQLPIDRLLHRRGHGRRSRLDETELDERLHIGLGDGFSPDPREDAVEKLLSIRSAVIQNAKGKMQTEDSPPFRSCVLHFAF